MQNIFIICFYPIYKPLLHRVLSAIGLGFGHSGLLPSQVDDQAQSLSDRQTALCEAGTNLHVSDIQHGPCDGLK